jgi:phage baseplate assembly protein W
MSDEATGFPFPFRIDPATGGVPLVRGTAKIRQNMVHLLLVDPGERVMKRDYGGGLRALVGDPNNDALRAIVQRQLDHAIRRYEPRVELHQVAVRQETAQGLLWADLSYTARPDLLPTSVRVPIAGVAV